MKRAQNTLSWPLWLWSVQLLPATFLLIFAVFGMALEVDQQIIDWRFVLIFIVGSAWLISAMAMLIWPRGRMWLVARWREWCLTAAAALIGLALLDITLTITGIVPTMEDHRARSISYSFGRFTSPRLIGQIYRCADSCGPTLWATPGGLR